jgi:hypothetical protein
MHWSPRFSSVEDSVIRPKLIDPKTFNKTEDADAFSVDEFCARHRISPQLFYKLKPQGLMPTTFNVGARVLISREAAAAWRRARELATGAESSATTGSARHG